MSFLSHLSKRDLNRLRTVVRRVHMRHIPDYMMTDRECDRIIEALGPKVAEEQLRAHFKRLGFETAIITASGEASGEEAGTSEGTSGTDTGSG